MSRREEDLYAFIGTSFVLTGIAAAAIAVFVGHGA
jgi:hypothetical protein